MMIKVIDDDSCSSEMEEYNNDKNNDDSDSSEDDDESIDDDVQDVIDQLEDTDNESEVLALFYHNFKNERNIRLLAKAMKDNYTIKQVHIDMDDDDDDDDDSEDDDDDDDSDDESSKALCTSNNDMNTIVHSNTNNTDEMLLDAIGTNLHSLEVLYIIGANANKSFLRIGSLGKTLRNIHEVKLSDLTLSSMNANDSIKHIYSLQNCLQLRKYWFYQVGFYPANNILDGIIRSLCRIQSLEEIFIHINSNSDSNSSNNNGSGATTTIRNNTTANIYDEDCDEDNVSLVTTLIRNYHETNTATTGNPRCNINARMRLSFECLRKIGHLPNLKRFELRHLYLSVNHIQSLVEGITEAKNHSLEFVDLCDTGLDDQSAIVIAKLLQQDYHNHTQSKLCNNEDNYSNITSRPVTILKELYVSNNYLSEMGGIAIANALMVNTTLQTLNISNNQLGSNTGHAIANMLQFNTTLSYLYVSGTYNNLGYDAYKAIIRALKYNTTLHYLSLGNSNECILRTYYDFQVCLSVLSRHNFTLQHFYIGTDINTMEVVNEYPDEDDEDFYDSSSLVCASDLEYLQAKIQFYLELNRAGRKKLLISRRLDLDYHDKYYSYQQRNPYRHGNPQLREYESRNYYRKKSNNTSNTVVEVYNHNKNDWIQTLNAITENLSCLFYFIRKNPSLCCNIDPNAKDALDDGPEPTPSFDKATGTQVISDPPPQKRVRVLSE